MIKSKTTILLFIHTLLGVTLVLYRTILASNAAEKVFTSEHSSITDVPFLFLLWNLFLAWIPYLLSIGIKLSANDHKQEQLNWLVLVVWLLFFPNAPYLVTDLLHLKPRAPIPFLYDALLFFFFACLGLMLAYLSLAKVQAFLIHRFSRPVAWSLIFLFMALSSFGIYIGRFLRWNSWDVLIQPQALAYSLGHLFQQNESRPSFYLLTGLMSVLLMVGYISFSQVVKISKK
ncbi:MAG TPA: DUF1361 domain-containing protein [Saprospiraceae bacterium]|nr:DUF1361 domain-containing protein [Saprospiraceae bacterium]HMQ81680.1 DUF1361 domain-containing protein [Saprospiraceae bacterium]